MRKNTPVYLNYCTIITEDMEYLQNREVMGKSPGSFDPTVGWVGGNRVHSQETRCGSYVRYGIYREAGRLLTSVAMTPGVKLDEVLIKLQVC